jgi:hypothetical protein
MLRIFPWAVSQASKFFCSALISCSALGSHNYEALFHGRKLPGSCFMHERET